MCFFGALKKGLRIFLVSGFVPGICCLRCEVHVLEFRIVFNPNLVAEWIHFINGTHYNHYKTESVNFWGLMNSATKLILNPKPLTLNPKPLTLKSKAQTQTDNPKL